MTRRIEDAREFSFTNIAGFDTFKGLIWDRDRKSIVANIPAPSERFFAVLIPQFFKAGQEILIEIDPGDKRTGKDPAKAEIRAIDGNLIVLRHALTFRPKPGASVAVCWGEKTSFMNPKEVDELAKKEERAKWI